MTNEPRPVDHDKVRELVEQMHNGQFMFGNTQPSPCVVGRRDFRAFDDTHDWRTPCPEEASVWVGGSILAPVGFCHHHGEAVIAAYNRDMQERG